MAATWDELRDQGDAVAAEATLATRGFRARPGLTIAAATLAGIAAMAVTFALALPVVVSLAALIAGILAVLALGAADIAWRIAADGIHRRGRPLAAAFLELRPRDRMFRFADIRHYRRETDLSRFHGEVERLTLALRVWPFRIVIHDMAGREPFRAFAAVFERYAAARGIPRRPGFYDTVWAKLVTFGFAAAALVLAALHMAGALSGTAAFRLSAVIVPGVLYMAWRTFGPRRTPALSAAARAQETGH